MHDQKIGTWFAVRGPGVPFNWASAVQTPALIAVVAAYYQNTQRAIDLCAIPQEWFTLGGMVKSAEIVACLMKFGEPRYETASMDAPLELVSDLIHGKVRGPFSVRPGGSLSSHFEDHAGELGATLDTLMTSQVLLIWAAFETMAGDLWEAAVNAHPQTLARLGGKLGRDKDKGKTLPMHYLEQHGYNLEHVMGTVLRDHRFSFAKLDNIEKAYRSAFPDGSKPGSEEFWQDASLKAICALRNLIVHKAGVVDEDFLKTRGPHPQVAHLSLNERFTPDGLILQRVFREFVAFSEDLMQSVDNWVATH
jgi:hypothetical protein